MRRGENTYGSINGQNLKLALKGFKISEGKIAELCNVTQCTVSNWMTGKTRIPADVLLAVCEIANLDPYDFFEKKND